MAELVLNARNAKDIPIAEIFGGDYDGVAIYLHEKKCCPDCSPACKPKKKCCDECFAKCCKKDVMKPMKSIELEEDESCFPIPKGNGTQHGYVFGPTGCGKSVFCANYASMYQKLYPQNDVYLVSYISNPESAVEKIRNIGKIPTKDIIAGEITTKTISNSLIIFDDVDCLPPMPVGSKKASKKKKGKGKEEESEEDIFDATEVFKAVEELRDQLLTTGRHDNVSVLVTSHIGANYKHTKVAINESAFIVVYPQSGNWHQVERMLKVYVGFNKTQVEEIRTIDSRWAFIYKQHPGYVVYEKGVYIP